MLWKEAFGMDSQQTTKVSIEFDKSSEVEQILTEVYNALSVKGYDPISQIVGYILSDDPTYITSYNGARTKITQIERDELLEELVKRFLKGIEEKQNK